MGENKGPIVAKKPRVVVVSKNEFLEAFTGLCKSKGVVFKKGNTYTQSKADYWNLFTSFKKFEAAAAASAGTRISLSGVGVYEFRESGRSPETRCLRMKFKPSSSIDNFFKDNQGLIKKGDATPAEEFVANIQAVMSGLDPRTASEEVIEVKEDKKDAASGDAAVI